MSPHRRGPTEEERRGRGKGDGRQQRKSTATHQVAPCGGDIKRSTSWGGTFRGCLGGILSFTSFVFSGFPRVVRFSPPPAGHSLAFSCPPRRHPHGLMCGGGKEGGNVVGHSRRRRRECARRLDCNMQRNKPCHTYSPMHPEVCPVGSNVVCVAGLCFHETESHPGAKQQFDSNRPSSKEPCRAVLPTTQAHSGGGNSSTCDPKKQQSTIYEPDTRLLFLTNIFF